MRDVVVLFLQSGTCLLRSQACSTCRLHPCHSSLGAHAPLSDSTCGIANHVLYLLCTLQYSLSAPVRLSAVVVIWTGDAVMSVACRAEREAVEQRKADLASALERRKASKKAGLQAEPAAGSLNTAAIRIRLPDGSTAQRRFLADQPLQVQGHNLKQLSVASYSFW